jgi:hypothetical protein
MGMTWEQIEERLRRGSRDDVIRLRSPTGEPLVVVFTGGDRLSLSVRCKKGWPRISVDGLDCAPPWVASIGPEFETT